ncbi:MAG: BREX-4 system phosphatase PglZ [Selenomonadaceae bacterium]|nr:BREX-4 system phosphatase PglZ [Selenomonadaceae bacterium]
METLSVAAATEKIRAYLKRDIPRPYFVISDGADECAEFQKIFSGTLAQIYISDFCAGDSPLDNDLLVERLDALERDTICFGLGGYIYFTAQEDILRELQDRNFKRKVIFICSGVANLLERLAEEDSKFRANQICRVAGSGSFSVVSYSANLNVPTDAKNFSALLKLAESGSRSITVQTDLPLENVREITSFYDAIKFREPDFSAPPDALSAQQCQEYFSDDNCTGYPPEHWRSFAAGFKGKILNRYLKFVFEHSAGYEDYLRNLFFALFDADDKNFAEFYALRKAAVKNISSPYLSEYVARVEKSATDAVKFLTDNTAAERRAMIRAVQGKEKIPAALEKNYPALADYLADFDYGDEELTEYFRRYRKIKLLNVDDENFKRRVRELALNRPFNRFETRQKLLERAGGNAKLYWLDALGAEFCGYIQARAVQFGLHAEIEIARADLPTLTSQNKYFYDDWRGAKFDKNQQLDELKHSPEKFDADGKCSAPTYLDAELEIIGKVIEEIKNALAVGDADKIILTSDHGASRLAVMYGRENKFRMNSVGEHSGRCCPINYLDARPDCASEENGYWVLANYDRFSGGRLSSVEVHGGATLEEILVPVVEFSLQGAETSQAEKIPAPLENLDEGFDFFE